MSNTPTQQQEYELDRALLDEHGPSDIETICSYADGMRAEGREADADDAMKQCERMRAILMPDRDLIRAYERTGGEGVQADSLVAEIDRRGLDL